jgi:uncharacterized protein (DUF2249 family)
MSSTIPVLDVRPVPPRERLETIMGAYRRLCRAKCWSWW